MPLLIVCVNNVREVVFNHLNNQFKSVTLLRLGMENFHFGTLNSVDAAQLSISFWEEEGDL